MKFLKTSGALLWAVLQAFPALAATGTTTTTGSTNAPGPDTATLEDLHRKRLRTEYLLLESSRTTTWGSDFGVEGRLLTLRIPLANWTNDQAPVAGLLSRRFNGGLQALHLADNNTTQLKDAVMNELPPFRLTMGSDGGTFNLALGAVENTLGHGALVQRYTNNPRGGFDLNNMGLVLGAQAKMAGGTLMIGNLLNPGRLVGFNVHGRPLEWIFGTYSNFAPEVAGNWDMYALLLSALTVGVSGAVDTTAPSVLGDKVMGGDWTAPRTVPGTVGGLTGEADLGINHSVIAAHIYGNATGLGRTFEEASLGPTGRVGGGITQTNLFGAGATVGARFNLFLEIIKIGGSMEYRLAGPNYAPTWFDRYYEADRLYGVGGGPKITQRSMARHGYNFQVGAQVLKTLGFFAEMSDLMQMDPRFGKNNGQLRLGGILHVLGFLDFLGAYVNRGFTNYGRMFAGDTTSMWLGEARMNLGPLNLVGRQWRTFEPIPTGGVAARDGTSFMAELVFGIL
jgi:hypothetical protein